MTRDEELLGAAIALQRWLGDKAPLYVAQRIGAAAVAGDVEAVIILKGVAAKMEELQTLRPS